MIDFLTHAIRTGMTFLYGSTGETLTEKSGHLNLGLPGIMSAGAAFGCAVEYIYGTAVGKMNVNPFLAVILPILAAFIGGMAMGLIYCFFTVTLHANQNVTGLILTTFGVGLTGYIISKTGSFAFAAKFFTKSLPVSGFFDSIGKSLGEFVSKIGPGLAKPLAWSANTFVPKIFHFTADPERFRRILTVVFGHLGTAATKSVSDLCELFLSYGIFVYLALAIALITSFVMTKTRVGLNLRAVGENPATADAAGINVTRYRYISTMIGSGIAGLGGLCYIMDNLFGSWEYTIEAVGWLAIALVIFTLWKPNIGIFGSILFGMLYNASAYIKNISFAQTDLLEMLPYVVTIIVLIITSLLNKKENQPPASLGLNYFREDR